MGHVNVEIKARCLDHELIRRRLRARAARGAGTDHQVDTYFRVARGRLKLREGRIENALIHCERDDAGWPRESRVTLQPVAPGSRFKEILAAALGVLVVVDKEREFYFADNVKFHLDTVRGLETFAEIEASTSRAPSGGSA